jgi:hypothetical protein
LNTTTSAGRGRRRRHAPPGDQVGLVAQVGHDPADGTVTVTMTGDTAEVLAQALIQHEATHTAGLVPDIDRYEPSQWLHVAIDLLSAAVRLTFDDAAIRARTVYATHIAGGRNG